jgi:hypothetical protein
MRKMSGARLRNSSSEQHWLEESGAVPGDDQGVEIGTAPCTWCSHHEPRAEQWKRQNASVGNFGRGGALQRKAGAENVKPVESARNRLPLTSAVAVGEQLMLAENQSGLRQINPRSKPAAVRLEDGLEVKVTPIEGCLVYSGTGGP